MNEQDKKLIEYAQKRFNEANEAKSGAAYLNLTSAAIFKLCNSLTDVPALLDLVERQDTELQKYRHAEAEGRLVVLPCKIGADVCSIDHGQIFKRTVHSIKILENGYIVTTWGHMPTEYNSNQVGAKLFFTREEAEAALAAKEGDME